MIHTTGMSTTLHAASLSGAMNSSNTSSSMSMPMMTPWLHLGGGDAVLFQQWKPVSPAAIAGVCVGLLLFAVLDRLLAALRRLMEGHWQKRRLALTGERDESVATPLLDSFKSLGRKDEGIDLPRPLAKQTTMTSASRLIMTMISPTELYRGLLYGLQALTTYILMLTAMTFHVAYIVSILVGLSFGEMLFGRLRPDIAVQANDACC
ncbi:hypothetical protein PLEOSDRAFT_1092022 [Pleurotus ostreatus PC15]|uniref:Copper transport protein n=1 Tax=Pleurotus ostreatus (strain PC15) TaxID=1137138 RepID=A0A067P103_PLEO1|nr:hypothetical protein PLEOSDRAFT_1092022 [Pleurotus ostreatus PC15]